MNIERMSEIAKSKVTRTVLAGAVLFAGSPMARPVEASSTISFGKGEEKPVILGDNQACALSGDVEVDGVKVHDSDALSADTVEFRRNAQVKAVYGASGICGTDAEVAAWLEQTKASKLASGKFARVNPIVIASSVVNEPNYTGTCTTDSHLDENGEADYPAGTVIKGDIEVNGAPLYDNKPETGLITELTENAHVKARWGANVQVVKNCMPNATELREVVKNRFVEQMHESGCEDDKGCKHVDVIKAPGGRQGLTLSLPVAVLANMRGNY